MYETELKAPLLALIEELNEGLAGFAPEHVRPAPKSMMRIYRDIRFSANKAPYKTQVAAWWAKEGMAKTTGAGFYLSVSATELTVAAGVYAPDKGQLLALRRHLAEHAGEFRSLVKAAGRRGLLELSAGEPMTRPPKGFGEMGLSEDRAGAGDAAAMGRFAGACRWRRRWARSLGRRCCGGSRRRLRWWRC